MIDLTRFTMYLQNVTWCTNHKGLYKPLKSVGSHQLSQLLASTIWTKVQKQFGELSVES